ncbi:hypothetical protein BST16_06525 [Mycobacterium asiaticum DSM 44297]|nr:hypothetical protein BST16_06525 [Mycobacterium asiaticum DSM 44297]
MTFISQQAIRTDNRLGQVRDGIIRQLDRGLIDHRATAGGLDQSQACDLAGNGHPQHHVHLRLSFG